MFNPAVFLRDWCERLRSVRTLVSILAVAALSTVLVWMRWPTDSRMDIVSQGAMQVFRPLAYALACAVMLLIPAFPATSIVKERRSGTLLLLLQSPLLRADIYGGKFLSNLLLAAVLLSCSLPALAACVAMGGITISTHIVPLLVILCGMALQYTSLGLWISARGNSTDACLRWTYAAVLGVSVLSLAPIAIVGNVDSWQSFLAKSLTQLSPFGALRDITSSEATSTELALQTSWLQFLLVSVGFSAIVGLATGWQLNPIRFDRPKPTGVITEERSSGIRILRRFQFLVDPQKRKASIPSWINPVMVKEFRTRKFGRLHWLIRLVSLCGITSLLITLVAATGTVSWGVSRIAVILVLMQISLLVVLGPSLASGLIASERETGGWLLLRMTPLSPWKIVVGKLSSVFWTMALTLLATLPGYAVMIWIQPNMTLQVQRVIVSLLFCTALIIAISSVVSSFWSNAAAATATSYGILLTLFAGTLLIWLSKGKPFGESFVEKALLLNPTAAALAEIRTPGFENYQLTPLSWWIAGTVSGICLILLAVRVWQLTKPE